MSEHPSSNLNPNSPTSEAPASQTDWETLTFPHAMSVEEIPDQMQDAPVPPSLVSGDSFLKVQQDNQELRDQVAALDAALLRSQYALRSEMERWEALALAETESTESSETRLQNQNQELSGSQARLGQLFLELEQSHRMAQRQQILVETLTEQLQSSHEQIAQLERECAMAQARSAEQTQVLLQSEHTCRDLRSRLQRQQRYTLQFKAALEKCLDVPPATAQGVVADLLPEAPETIAAPLKLNIPRSQPVQPWSSPIEAEAKSSPAVLQNWANAVVNPVGNPVVNPVVNEPQPMLSAEPIVTQPIAAESEDLDTMSAIPSAATTAAAAISPDLSVEQTAEPAPQSISQSIPQSVSQSIPQSIPQSMPETERLDTWEAVLAQVQAIVGEDAKIVEAIEQEPISEEESASEDEAIAQDPILTKIRDIAPVIHAARSSAKKRESLAAVELPSFGRRV